MRIAIISLTENGAEISEKIFENFGENYIIHQYALKKYSSERFKSFENLSKLLGKIFNIYDAIMFICAAGIAVRCIAPYLKSKQSDPAVIVVDEKGKFAVSLLSGHIGGANELTKLTAEKIGAAAVITTATDTGGKFSPDSFAKANGLHICNIKMSKYIASEVLEGNKIGLYCEYPYKNLPCELIPNDFNLEYGIRISDSEKNIFKHTLNLIPKKFIIGTGCKKNISPDIFENYILEMLKKYNINLDYIYNISTADIKKDETALIKFSRKYNIPLKFYNADELMKLSGDFSVSEFVMKTAGTDNVCERSAVMGGNNLIIKKQSGSGITFALSEREINIDFERKIL